MNWLTKKMRALSPNCKEAIRLQSASLDQPITRLQRVGLRIHLVLCVWCARYGRQIIFLREAARNRDHVDEPAPPMPAQTRERIKHRLKTEGK